MWGLQPPEGTKVAWGARCIAEDNGRRGFSIVWNRQDAFGDAEERNKLQKRLNAGLLRQASDKWAELTLLCLASTGQSKRHELARESDEEGVIVIVGDACSSFGYVNIVAYPC